MKRLLFLVVFSTILLSFLQLGSVTLFDVDEAVFSEATREMIESSNWLTPTYNQENRYDKPILFYWLMAVSYKIFGVNEFGARFPSAVAGIILVISLFLFVRHFRDHTSALYSVLSCILSLYFVVYSHAAVTDMTLTLFIALSLFSFYLSIDKNGTSGKKSIFLLLFYFFSALAFLTKGLIGIVLPFGIAMVYAEITNGWKGIKKVLSLRGTVVFLVVALPWYVMQTLLNGREFIDAFFIKHHFTRYLEGVSGHIAPLYYFVPVLIIGMFPWIAFFASGIRNTLREKEPLNIFALVWFAFVFVFFSLSTTKLPNYILPAMPAVAILIAAGMTKEDKVWRYSNTLLIVVASLMGTAFIVSGKYLLKMGFSDVAWTSVSGAVMAAMAALGLYSLYAKRSAYFLLAVLMLIFLSVLLMKALPLASQYLQGTLYKYSLYAKYRLQEDSQLFVCGTNNPSIVFYSGRTIVPLRKKRDLSELIGNSGSSIAIAKEDEMNMLRNRGFHLLDSDGAYALFERECRIAKKPGERNARNGIPK